MRCLWLPTCLVLLSISATRGGRINVTIDDYFGDSKTGSQITYHPEGAWEYGPSCPNCTVRPDVKNAHLGMATYLVSNLLNSDLNVLEPIGTWHVGTFVSDLEQWLSLWFTERTER
jgi:hypothetical protein